MSTLQKKKIAREFKEGSAEYVVMRGRRAASKGHQPSDSYKNYKNPRIALKHAQRDMAIKGLGFYGELRVALDVSDMPLSHAIIIFSGHSTVRNWKPVYDIREAFDASKLESLSEAAQTLAQKTSSYLDTHSNGIVNIQYLPPLDKNGRNTTENGGITWGLDRGNGAVLLPKMQKFFSTLRAREIKTLDI